MAIGENKSVNPVDSTCINLPHKKSSIGCTAVIRKGIRRKQTLLAGGLIHTRHFIIFSGVDYSVSRSEQA